MKSSFLILSVLLALVVGALSIPVMAQPREPEGAKLETSSAAPARVGEQASVSTPTGGAPAASPNSKWQPNAILWDQPPSSINLAAHANQDFEATYDVYDIFIADDFQNASSWLIDDLFVPGDTWNGGCDLSCANVFNWEIYADAGGMPDGDPWGGGNPPVWSLSLPPSDPQVTLSASPSGWLSNVTLNPSSPVFLPAGSWWLSFFPGMDFDTCLCQAGRHAADTSNGYAAQVINPGSGFGFPPSWTSVQDVLTWGLVQQDFAFRISGTVGMPGWLDGHVMDAETGGTLPPCTRAEVHIEPSGLDIPVDLVSGYYGPSALISGTYSLASRAPGYSVETAVVDVITGVTTTQDFDLRRPVINVAPPDFISVTAFISRPVTHALSINNSGHLPLGFELREHLTSPILNAMSGAEQNPGIEVEPELLTLLNTDETSSYMIYFRKQPDLSPAFEMTWQERGWFVVNALQATAERTQARVRAYLDSQGASYQSFWIDNVIVVEGSNRATFNNLMNFGEIAALRVHRVMQVIEPIKGSTPINPMPDGHRTEHLPRPSRPGLGVGVPR